MENISFETYPETPSEIHNTATEQAIANLFNNFDLPYSSRILDVPLDVSTDTGYSGNYENISIATI
ncbi:MAG: hypothetical protein PHC49_00945 [Desulfuromonadaceae bacterium]|nr:hypothetical protein [Desulfuromonadaceae bacterium]